MKIDPVIGAFIGAFVMLWVVGLLIAWRLSKRPTCPYCAYPQHKCSCEPGCTHPETFLPRWSQDGWIAPCKLCGDVVYLGDE